MLAESYQVLQVPFGAEMPQIRQAYRRLVLQYHPDRNQQPGAKDTFLRVQAAYEYLQRYQETGIANPSRFTAPSSPPKSTAEAEKEKYQYVYEPPQNPAEFAAWARVAKARAQQQKEKDQAAFIHRIQDMKTKWWYQPARLGSYFVLVVGFLLGLFCLLLPFLFLLSPNPKMILMGIFLLPMGMAMIKVMRTFREEIRRNFGENIPPSAS